MGWSLKVIDTSLYHMYTRCHYCGVAGRDQNPNPRRIRIFLLCFRSQRGSHSGLFETIKRESETYIWVTDQLQYQ